MPARLSCVLCAVLFATLLVTIPACDEANGFDDSLVPSQAMQESSGTRGGAADIEMRLNHNPVIESMTAAWMGPDAQEIRLEASDPDQDVMAFAWSTTCAGDFDDARAPRPVFTYARPLPATCTFHVELDDGQGGRQSGELTLAPVPPTVRVGLGPSIGMTFQSEENVAPGGRLSLGITVATDAAVSFRWEASAGQIREQSDVQPTAGQAGRSQIEWVAPDDGGDWSVTVVVSDEEGLSARYRFVDLRR